MSKTFTPGPTTAQPIQAVLLQPSSAAQDKRAAVPYPRLPATSEVTQLASAESAEALPRSGSPRALGAATAGPPSVGHRFSDLAIDRPTAMVPNNTGLPDRLKAGIENLSGMAMDDVRVHYNSARPAALSALAYTQGSEIHVGPGQEQHLAHEAWHVVQQKQGRVQETLQAKGLPINLDQSLEAEADAMGARAEQPQRAPNDRAAGPRIAQTGQQAPIQLFIPPVEFLKYVDKLRKKIETKDQKLNEQRLFHWNAAGAFDETYYADYKQRDGKQQDAKQQEELRSEALLARMTTYHGISSNAGGGALRPGQANANEELPGYLNYFAEFIYPLPAPLQEFSIRFLMAHDRMTAHGWISTNCTIPKGTLGIPRDLAVHMIIAVDEKIQNDVVVCNPHVTVRLKSVQDHLTMISMLNDQQAKSAEMQKLGKAASNASMSVGLHSDRKKEGAGAAEILGVGEDFLDLFTKDWIAGVIGVAEKAAAGGAVKKPKKFTLK